MYRLDWILEEIRLMHNYFGLMHRTLYWKLCCNLREATTSFKLLSRISFYFSSQKDNNKIYLRLHQPNSFVAQTKRFSHRLFDGVCIEKHVNT